MTTYDVALWRFWPSSEFPITDEIEASSPLLAALNLMHRCRLKHASYVAVAAPGGVIISADANVSRCRAQMRAFLNKERNDYFFRFNGFSFI
ncbi:hypothetical protein [Dictyobacter kobayashii]|uniref:Uncharacterized protein n=1 Tax=Dictyobacter kobayashii TaxID=2014872 RepID=A0A402AEK6_9CHLR|nr:hypothetical protein [Dictyobacter kobayashii]GCE17548.1 hypothetical protein KDK_13480 [Dictyobacter kobayashii]